MARTLHNAKLETRTARARLKSGKRHWWRFDNGAHLGYRRGPDPQIAGRWLLRLYNGKGTQAYTVETLPGRADDIDDADNMVTLSFDQATAKVRERLARSLRTAAGFPANGGELTVADALEAYCDWLDAHRKSGPDARGRLRSMVVPTLGEIPVAKLTTQQIEDWLRQLAESRPRTRGKRGDVNYRTIDLADPEARRARQANANRTFNYVRAALNKAWREELVANNGAWARVRPFSGVDSARVRYLSEDEARRLVRACEPTFGRLVQGALATGCRYGELAGLRVEDYHPDAGTLHIRRSKSGKARHVVLGPEGVRLFASYTAGRPHGELIFRQAHGSPWFRTAQILPMRAAVKAARIKPATFHCLRHTWASLSVMAGMPLMVVARNLGHSDVTMVQQHYGHLSPDYIADAIRQHAPSFGFDTAKVVPARRMA